MDITKRPKYRESTLCTWAESGQEIKEGDILCCGDNYPCVVLYNIYEAKFEAIEFGYAHQKRGYLFRAHDIQCYTRKWKVIGNIDDNPKLMHGYRKNFSLTTNLKKYYKY